MWGGWYDRKPQLLFHWAHLQVGLRWRWIRRYRCFSLSFSLESAATSSSFLGNIHARAAAAVPSPLCLEKQRKVAQTKAQQPVKVVRTYSGTREKLRNWGGNRVVLVSSFCVKTRQLLFDILISWKYLWADLTMLQKSHEQFLYLVHEKLAALLICVENI